MLLVCLVIALAPLPTASVAAGSPPPASAVPAVSQLPIQVGTSFNPRHADYLGLDWKEAYQRLLAMHFKVIRLSAYWDQADSDGYQQLDWLMESSRSAGQPVVLSVGMKGLGWPEFYLPAWLTPPTPDGGDVGREGPVAAATRAFVGATVERYRDNPALVAWQVENEPLNPAGPRRWFIGPELLRSEVALVRSLDSRPLIVTAFGHFNMLFDQASHRSGFDLRGLLGFQSASAEGQALGLLRKNDILGLDVYTEIGYSLLGHAGVSRAGSDWAAKAGQWRRNAVREGKRSWITEAQAEPWEASMNTYGDPRSTSAPDIAGRFSSLRSEGFRTILLWGAEYWLWRADRGDPSWLEEVERILRANADAPPMALPVTA